MNVDELAREKFFMTYKELAEYLNLSKPTIEELLINNGMKYYMVGSTYRFKKSDVDEFMEKITSHMDIHNNDLKQINVKKLLEVQMVKFTLQLLLISLITVLASAFIAFHVGLAIYLLGSTIALLNYEHMEEKYNEN